MNKAILLSVRPEHAVNILNGTKTLELRKRVPKGFNGLVYVYVTKAKPLFVYDRRYKKGFITNHEWKDDYENGKVVARFWFDDYDVIKRSKNVYNEMITDITIIYDKNKVILPKEETTYLDKLCLTKEQIIDYGKGKDLYAWHIKNLEILDEPMALDDFRTWNKGDKWTPDMNWLILKRAPQSWQYVYVKE